MEAGPCRTFWREKNISSFSPNGPASDVEVGDEVQEGQALCTVEAMKMENILRAEKKGTVSKINAAAGDSLAVDEVIMEFE